MRCNGSTLFHVQSTERVKLQGCLCLTFCRSLAGCLANAQFGLIDKTLGIHPGHPLLAVLAAVLAGQEFGWTLKFFPDSRSTKFFLPRSHWKGTGEGHLFQTRQSLFSFPSHCALFSPAESVQVPPKASQGVHSLRGICLRRTVPPPGYSPTTLPTPELLNNQRAQWPKSRNPAPPRRQRLRLRLPPTYFSVSSPTSFVSTLRV